MKFKYITPFSAIIALLIVSGCGKSEQDAGLSTEKKESSSFAVILTPNTAIRIDPLIFTTRIAQLKKGEVGEILDRSSEKKPVAGMMNYWYKIKLKSGITGWVYGSNLKILEDSDTGNVETYLSQFWEEETKELSESLHGKWWSVNKFNDFTYHVLEIYKDGKYKSYYKGGAKKIEGDYTFDFNKNQIIFLNNTSFEGDLNYYRRGDDYSLIREDEKNPIKFKKINVNPESESEENKLETNTNDADEVKKENEG